MKIISVVILVFIFIGVNVIYVNRNLQYLFVD